MIVSVFSPINHAIYSTKFILDEKTREQIISSIKSSHSMMLSSEAVLILVIQVKLQGRGTHHHFFI